MLELSNIKKDYQLKDQNVAALKGISICFRRSEFVSILGPSGCGKTTLLNIVGGLDKYTSGDLLIDGTSTKEFKDKHWDNYRNHRVGFVFQSYNLIPHQTVLENVELALTLSGIKKAERRKRAIAVLEKVGLGDKLKSKPNQLSGGQMQRVSIARALVNNPEIILADEPTGALDSKTSVQIMDLLKEVSKDRLVIMVTHNPELAEKYSSRIVRLLDGEIIEDSKPYSKKDADKEILKHKEAILKAEQEKQAELNKQGKKHKKRKEKTSMSIFTAMFLSLKNLLTKKGRTLLVAFAGSIGILGIALVLAVSSGMTGYINNMQSESLSSYPISISPISVNMDNITGSGMNTDIENKNKDEIVVYDMLETIVKYGNYNYINKDFVTYVNNYYSNPEKQKLINAYDISYTSETNLITTLNKNSLMGIPQDKLALLNDQIFYSINNPVTFSAMSGSASSSFFKELDKNYVTSIYNVTGNYPTQDNEIALVLNSNSIDNASLVSLGIDLPKKSENGQYNPIKLTDFLDKEYKLILNNGYYENVEGRYQPKLNFSTLEISAKSQSMLEKQQKLAEIFAEPEEQAKTLKVTAVLTLKDDASGSIFSDGLMYTNALAEEYRLNCKQSDIVQDIINKYTYNEEEFTNNSGDISFVKPYTVYISEMSLLQVMGYNVDISRFSYNSPNEMKAALKNYFNIELTPQQIIDIYLQVYGASDTPTLISFYANSFDSRDDIISMIKTYNETAKYKLEYSDSSSMLTNMLKSMINIISYVLIAFAAISLVVSSIMIAIITYTSVIERTKEIGVLRSVGASKRDVSNVFNAETIIIGLLSGVLGVAIAGILTFPISGLLKSLTGVGGLAVLNPLPCLVLILISTVLTLIAGLVPARIASKKDPVLALRTE